MPFIPHTPDDITQMLDAIGVERIADLFDEIPASLLNSDLPRVPESLNEMQVTRLMSERAARDGGQLNFIGAGAYEHHIPAAVWQIATRGEFYSAYTPYQAEASQGTLQLLYEWQTMMASLTGMEVSNASLYDGASAVAEAVLMAVRVNKAGVHRVLIPANLHPFYRATLCTLLSPQKIAIAEIAFDPATGRIDQAALEAAGNEPFAALVINQPNFFGVLESPDALTDWAHDKGALVIGVSNPLTLALIKPAGEWGSNGADIACGEAQPFGIPLSSGGPYVGYLCCKQSLVRQMPGRLAGRTVDLDGKPGYTLTLQAREQHIRRAKATSNICTNQGLMVTAATIHLALLGAQGIEEVAAASHDNTRILIDKLTAIPGIQRVFESPYFHESVIRLPCPVAPVLENLLQRNILGGLDLAPYYPDFGNALLVCATETKTENDLNAYADAMRAALEELSC
jgi:glycine dehydrogenase subunit 1